MYRAALTIVVALVVGVLALAAGTPSVSAQVSPSDDVLNEAQVREFRSWLDKTNSADDVTKKRWRDIFSRNMRKTLPGLSRTLVVRGGLAGAAAGIWIHNGVVLSSVAHCGETSCPDPLVLTGEFRKAQELSQEGGHSAGYFESHMDGQFRGAGVVESVEYRFDPLTSECFAEIRWLAKFQDPSSSTYGAGSVGATGPCSMYLSPTPDKVGGPDDPLSRQGVVGSSYAQGSTARFYVQNTCESDCTERTIGNAFPVHGDYYWLNPVYDVGGVGHSAPAEYQPQPGDYVSPPEETKALYDSIKADPEYQPATDDLPAEEPVDGEGWKEEHDRRAGVLAPEHGGEVWTRDNPDGSRTTRFSDGTELTTWPDGTQMFRRADGTEEWTYPDGTEQTWNPNTGEEITKWPDGTTRIRRWNDPAQRNQRPPDHEEWTDPQGGTRPQPTPQEQIDMFPEPQTRTPPTPGGPTDGGDYTCTSPSRHVWVTPEMQLSEKFPFSLVVRFNNALEAISQPGSAPSFDIPVIGHVGVPPSMHTFIQTIRGAFGVVLLAGMGLWVYRYVSGKGSESNG